MISLCSFPAGHLNQQELALRLDHFVKTNPLTENVHNQLLAGIYSNVARELPEAGVAPWVSANDKPSVVSKPVSGDAVEQRLKTEVMQLPARDRRRLKEAPEVDRVDMPLHDLSLYHAAKQFKVPDAVPTSAGAAHKTSESPCVYLRSLLLTCHQIGISKSASDTPNP